MRNTYEVILRGAFLVNFVPAKLLVGEVNRDAAVFGRWTDTEDVGVRDPQGLREKLGNLEAASLIWSIPNYLLIGQAMGIEDVSNIALLIIRDALLKAPAVRELIYWVANSTQRRCPRCPWGAGQPQI